MSLRVRWLNETIAMDFIPYSCQEIDEADIAAVVAALRSDFLTQGPRLAEFETRFAALHNAGEAVAVSNATAALHIGCLALGAGPGSHVWTTPNSFLASANCALYCGARRRRASLSHCRCQGGSLICSQRASAGPA